ncbi:hypothetical protein GUITHDRAFT_147191 [Guillardia theta CCMP2712]|uniref:Uncharacterized protein n=1 Tax=Guillardia theta (strain CCMP2712) TaxID=905079 RepID=L1IEG9_GUITC|nr:hypothetical protein GUITHDRAFT_147191 [Guillardia theta CCMP2712]EKX34492.1 hypothetical protein GUITHDRAFT_147191 [Guillardia theta CCMP2712]|eukprot:XP_005821472.1 hypothetical protein GUITHDRAFT_147191 [Guillardia theta CCMP2712]
MAPCAVVLLLLLLLPITCCQQYLNCDKLAVTQKYLYSNWGILHDNCETCLQGTEATFMAEHPCDKQVMNAFLLLKEVSHLFFFKQDSVDVFLTDVISGAYLSITTSSQASSATPFSIPIIGNTTGVQDIMARYPSECNINLNALHPTLKDIMLEKQGIAEKCYSLQSSGQYSAVCSSPEYSSSSYCNGFLEMWYGAGRAVSISQEFEACSTLVQMGNTSQEYCWAYIFYDSCPTASRPYVSVTMARPCKQVCGPVVDAAVTYSAYQGRQQGSFGPYLNCDKLAVTQKYLYSNWGILHDNCETCLQGTEATFMAEHPCDKQVMNAFLLLKEVSHLFFFKQDSVDVFLTDVISGAYLSITTSSQASSATPFSIPIIGNTTGVQDIMARYPSECNINLNALHPTLKDIMLEKQGIAEKCYSLQSSGQYSAVCSSPEYSSGSYCNGFLEMWYGAVRAMGNTSQEYCWAYIFYDSCPTASRPYVSVTMARPCKQVCGPVVDAAVAHPVDSATAHLASQGRQQGLLGDTIKEFWELGSVMYRHE